uniref:Uncharacterized protein n=1 Tax=Octopus bimaculoides TaxID=37653 RepID=A0A0L8H7I1_OCTBM
MYVCMYVCTINNIKIKQNLLKAIFITEGKLVQGTKKKKKHKDKWRIYIQNILKKNKTHTHTNK